MIKGFLLGILLSLVAVAVPARTVGVLEPTANTKIILTDGTNRWCPDGMSVVIGITHRGERVDGCWQEALHRYVVIIWMPNGDRWVYLKDDFATPV